MKDLVDKHGKNWQKISCLMKNQFKRSGKQIRDRYTNVLDKTVKKLSWSEEEDQVLLKNFKIYGCKWAKISKFLPGRPENSVKNRFHSYLKKTQKFINNETDDKEEEDKTAMEDEKLKTIKKERNLMKNSEKTMKNPLSLNINSSNTSSSQERDKDIIGLKPYRYNSSEEAFGIGLTSSSKENIESNIINSLLPHDVLKLRLLLKKR